MKDEYLVIRIDPKRKKEIKQLALNLDLTITDLVLKALEQYESEKDEEI